MNRCMHCGLQRVTIDYTCSLFEIGLEGEGTVIVAHCVNCGAEIYTVAEQSDISNISLISLDDVIECKQNIE